MTQYTDLEYLKLSAGRKFWYKFLLFFVGIGHWFKNSGLKIGYFFSNLGEKIADEFRDIVRTFASGDYKTRTSYFILGFGSIARKQYVRGFMFLLMEIVFILYMVFFGGHWLSMLGSLGKVARADSFDPSIGTYGAYDNSFDILLFSILTVAFIIGFIWTWRLNIKQNKISEQILREGRRLKTAKEDLASLLDEQFHKTMLALPLLGIIVFTILPTIFMVLVAFTNYGDCHDPQAGELFNWVGFSNFSQLFVFGESGAFGTTFAKILLWTLVWAFFATFLNYIIGTLVALMINRKGVMFKKVWRSILVLTIAIPQFISLLYVSKLFDDSGLIIARLREWGWVTEKFSFWQDKTWSRVLVIVINLWIGIPYLMLIATGILMNIPADLYESAKIDGASGVKQFTKITLPYLLFVTGPYLLTSFTGNINNFNVIYLLTGGGPANSNFDILIKVTDKKSALAQAGDTDLLITWLFKVTVGAADAKLYNLAAVISIMIFIVVSLISLIVYNLLPSNRNEEDYS